MSSVDGGCDGPREQFAMIGASIIVSDLDAECIVLYAYLDLKQGSRGHAPRGIRAIARALGWTSRTTRKHIGHLADRGLAEETKDDGHGRTAVRLVHQPARGVVNGQVRLGKPKPLAAERYSPPVGQRVTQGSGVQPSPSHVPDAAQTLDQELTHPVVQEMTHLGARPDPQIGGSSDCSEEGVALTARCARCRLPAGWWCELRSGVEEHRCARCKALGDVADAWDVVHGEYPDKPFTAGGDPGLLLSEPLAVVIEGRFGIASKETFSVGEVVRSEPTPAQALSQGALMLAIRTFDAEVVERIETEAVA